MTAKTTQHAFRLLGIAPTDDQKEIRRAWRALVRSYHPDLAKSDRAAANRKMAEINEAFDVVMTYAADRHRPAQARATQREDVARRMAAARRAEERRQAEARQAEAERRAEAERQARARRDAEAAQRAQAARRKAENLRAKEAAKAQRAADAQARRDKGALVPSHRTPVVDHAVRAFSSAIASFTTPRKSSEHNRTC